MNKIIVAMFAILLSTSLVSSAVFIKYDGVDGESADANHDKWIDVLSIDWGTTSSTDGDPGVSLVELHTQVGKATPKLFLACAEGSHVAREKLEICDGRGRNQECYFRANFEEITFLEQNLHLDTTEKRSSSRSRGRDRITESITFNFESVEMIYIDPSGVEHSSGPVSFGSAR